MKDRRPDPDALLRAINADQRSSDKGTLRIFLGMCAGVGKTYAMLESAHTEIENGVDVVVGLVETHGRAETEGLLHGLEVIPRLTYEHRDSTIADLDVDAILARRPQLVLIDELAHSNPQGARHKRRYQDIEEILDHGINVYTTLNVQHLESRADDVEHITGVPVRERVPDNILLLASEIEVVDITPDELLTRLKDGKVYTPDRSTVARFNFFRRGNLVALREMALRSAAERVDRELRTYRDRYAIDATWPTTQCYLVAVSPDDRSQRLIRWTVRMAQEHRLRWVAGCVRPSRPLTAAQERSLKASTDLVHELGGEIEWIDDDDVVNGVLTIAHRINATTIVVGRSRRKRILGTFLKTNTATALVEHAPDVSVHVVTIEEDADGRSSSDLTQFAVSSSPWSYVITILSSIVLLLVGTVLLPTVGYQAVGMGLLLYVTLLPAIAPRGPVLVTAFFTAIAWNVLFIPPRFTLHISKLEDQLTFAIYLTTALTSAWLSTRIRRRERLIRRREETTDQLYALATETSAAINAEDVADILVRRVSMLIDADVSLLIPANTGSQGPLLCYGAYTPGDKDMAAASWVMGHARPAGVGTETLPYTESRFIPLSVGLRVIGVLGLRPRTTAARSFQDQGVVDRIARQTAWSVDRIRLTEEASRVQRAEDAEELARTILNAVSHELRTPMSSIIASASTLRDVVGDTLSEAQRVLADDIQSSAVRLNAIVSDLLDMARIDSGKLEIRRSPVDLRETTDIVLQRVKGILGSHRFFVELDPPAPSEIMMDPTILLQILVNLIENAIRHTPPETNISLTIRTTDHDLAIVVDDDGPGIADHDLDHVFDRFWKGRASSGSGLGLSIVKGLVVALDGRIVASRSPIGGARFSVTIPIKPTYE